MSLSAAAPILFSFCARRMASRYGNIYICIYIYIIYIYICIYTIDFMVI